MGTSPAISLVAVVLVSTAIVGSQADITGTSPSNGACLCVTASVLNQRDSACGSVSGQLSRDECLLYAGEKQGCSLEGTSYEFFKLQNGEWSAGIYLRLGSSTDCDSAPTESPGTTPSGGCPQIVGRREWNGRNATSYQNIKQPIPRVFIHHTDSGFCSSQSKCSAAVRNIQDYHMDTNGWADIGYNFLVGEDGNVYEGRGWNRVGAHAELYNPTAIGISVIGNYTGRPPNSAALDAVQRLIACGVSMGKLSGNYTLHGHRDGGCTECPGQAFYDLIETWDHYGGHLSGCETKATTKPKATVKPTVKPKGKAKAKPKAKAKAKPKAKAKAKAKAKVKAKAN